MFTSSNALACPVVSHLLTAGSESFVLSDDESEFTLTMTEESNTIEKLHEYKV
jgi:hypothetical protein